MIGIIGAMEEENRILLENMAEKTEETHFHLVFTALSAAVRRVDAE